MQPTDQQPHTAPTFMGVDLARHPDNAITHLGGKLAGKVPKQCTQAVRDLVKLARMDCGGSQVAAEVLLGTYDGNSYPMDLTELCRLDENYYKAAIAVIHLRCRLNIEPHRLLANGDDVFQQLAQEWAHLRAQH